MYSDVKITFKKNNRIIFRISKLQKSLNKNKNHENPMIKH